MDYGKLVVEVVELAIGFVVLPVHLYLCKD